MDTVRFITEDETLAKDSAADFRLILAHREIGAPGVKSDMVSIPYRNGAFNSYPFVSRNPIYDNRTIKIEFLYLENGDREGLISEIYDFIHGRNLWIEFSDDLGYWYKSIITNIESVKETKLCLKISISCDCMPYKYDRNSTLVDWEWDALDLRDGIINDQGLLEIPPSNTAAFKLICRKKKAYPKITTDQNIVVRNRATGFYTNCAAGNTTLYELDFKEGENSITIKNLNSTAPAVVSIDYRGEKL